MFSAGLTRSFQWSVQTSDARCHTQFHVHSRRRRRCWIVLRMCFRLHPDKHNDLARLEIYLWSFEMSELGLERKWSLDACFCSIISYRTIIADKLCACQDNFFSLWLLTWLLLVKRNKDISKALAYNVWNITSCCESHLGFHYYPQLTWLVA